MSTHQSIPKPTNANKKSDILPIPAQSKSHPVIAQPKIESTRSNEEQLAQMRAKREASERLGSTLITPESVPRTLPPLQPKLTIGQPGDQYEQEADRVARQVVDQINAPPKIQAKETHQPMFSVEARKPSPLDHLPAPRVQRQATGGEMDASPDLESSIQRARGGGQPLGDGIRERMEGASQSDSCPSVQRVIEVGQLQYDYSQKSDLVKAVGFAKMSKIRQYLKDIYKKDLDQALKDKEQVYSIPASVLEETSPPPTLDTDKSEKVVVEEWEGREDGVYVNKPENGKEAVIKISGLISCVGIIIEGYGQEGLIGVAGSHFVTPNYFQNGVLNHEDFNNYMSKIIGLVAESSTKKARLFYNKGAFETKSKDVQDAETAAEAINQWLKTNGVTEVETIPWNNGTLQYHLETENSDRHYV